MTKSALTTMLCILMLTIAHVAIGEDFIDELDLDDAVRIAEQDLYKYKFQLSKTNQGLKQQEQNIADTAQKEQKLRLELAEIEQQVIADAELLVSMYNQMQVQKLKTFTKKEILKTTNTDKNILALQTQKRLAAYYRMGEIGVMNITFTSSSLPELVNFHEYYRYMLRQDRELISRFRSKLTELQQARQAHIAEAKRLEIALEETKQQQIILAASQKERYKLIEQIQIEQSLYTVASQQLEQSAQALIREIEELEKEASLAKQERENWMIATYPIRPHKKRKPSWLRGIGGHQKQLTPPIAGAVTKLFTPTATPTNKANFGINFKISTEAKVRAVFKGKVVYAGYAKGYGQLVIISHSDGYYTLTSSINTIIVKKGDSVEQGEELGYISQHGASLQQDLHFEIRLKEAPLDPLDWLDLNYIIFSPELEALSQTQ